MPKEIVTSGGLFTGVAISGATAATYELTADDVEELLYCEVTATNAAGSAMKQSDATGEIVDAPWDFETDLAGLQVSYDFTNAAYNTLDGSNGISSANDRSGNARHAVQATSAQRPILTAAYVNGLSAAAFTTANATTLSPPNAFTGFTAGSIFIAAKQHADPLTVPSSEGAFFDIGHDGQSSHHPYHSNGVIYDGFGTTARKTVGDPTDSVANWFIWCIISGPSDYRFYMNGTLVYSTATNTVGFHAAPFIGRNRDSTYIEGHIAKIVITNTVLSDAERQAGEGRLAHLLGITSVLPGDHPYKTDPP